MDAPGPTFVADCARVSAVNDYTGLDLSVMFKLKDQADAKTKEAMQVQGYLAHKKRPPL